MTNVFRHNLDVMHIKKNMFEDIFNMVMDVKKKIKDNIKARMNIVLFCDHHIMELLNDGVCVAKPKDIFSLDKKKTQFIVYEWLNNLQFPNGYA
jgi:hypothetical protein